MYAGQTTSTNSCFVEYVNMYSTCELAVSSHVCMLYLLCIPIAKGDESSSSKTDTPAVREWTK